MRVGGESHYLDGVALLKSAHRTIAELAGLSDGAL
jgi:hypothetical protein